MPSEKYTSMLDLLSETWAAWQPWMTEAKKDLQFYLGDQWTDQEKAYLDEEGRPHLVINKNIRRFVHLLTGYQRQNRLAIGFDPFEGSDAKTSEQFSNLMIHHLEKRNGYHQISQVFKQNIKVGIDWLNLYMDYNDDLESGDINFRRTPWTKILCDPLFQEITCEDMNFLFRREYLTKKQLEMLMPAANVDKEFEKMSEGQYGPILDPGQNILSREDRYLLTEYWYKQWDKKPHILNRNTGEIKPVDFPNKQTKERMQYVLSEFPELQLFNKRVKTVKLELFIGEDDIWHGDDPNGAKDIPYVPMICYYDPEYDEMKWKLQGIVRSLRDPQSELNKRRSQILHMINTVANSGWMWEDGAMADEEQMKYASGSGVQIRLKPGGLSKLQQLQANRFPGELIKIEEMFAADAIDISGINAELLSTVEKDMPGIAIGLRQRQGLVQIQDIFDNLRTAKKEIGRRFLQMVQSNYSVKKVMRILNEQPTPEFYTHDFQRYDAIVDEAQNSPTQRDAQFQKMMWFHQNVTPVHPMILLELADIPERYREAQGQMMMQAMGQTGPGGPVQGMQGGKTQPPGSGMRQQPQMQGPM